tara:strand:- start:2386 stop:2745 length:360 start_codon:yes stop_codon:yes gene_type:complete
MIKIVKETRDEENNRLYLTLRPQPYSEGAIKLTLGAVDEYLDKMGVKRGPCLKGETVSNKNGHDFEFVYKLKEEPKEAPAKVEEKVDKKVDKSSENVIMKKKTPTPRKKVTTRRKKTGG